MAFTSAVLPRPVDSVPPAALPRRRMPWGVAVCVAAVIAGRLLYLHERLRPDEAGYLTVGAQWHAGGTSLYGNFWVDRPPLLITIFGEAARLGGIVPLRLFAIAGVVIAVVGVAWAGWQLAGRRGATWSAVMAAALLVSPVNVADEVNGELLAAPFIAIGFAAMVRALVSRSSRSAALSGAFAGACAVGAVLVKQNMVDLFVFAGVMMLLCAWALGTRRIVAVAAGFAAGAAGMATVVAAWTLAHGTSLRGVWFAMYRFRFEAGRQQLASGLHAGDLVRRHAMLESVLLNGMVLAALLIVEMLVTRDRRDPDAGPLDAVRRRIPVALVVMLAYETFSILAGRHYFARYALELVVPLSVGMGLCARRYPRLGKAVVTLTAVVAFTATVTKAGPAASAATRAGQAIARVARPGDTITVMDGHPNVRYAAGLRDPYPYLWKTPEINLDPHAALLARTLGGAHAPTWFAASPRVADSATPALREALSVRYHPVTTLDHLRIWLRDGQARRVPVTHRNPISPRSHHAAP